MYRSAGSEDERHHHRDRTCKDQHPPVHSNLVEARNLRRGKAEKPARSHHRQENSQEALPPARPVGDRTSDKIKNHGAGVREGVDKAY